MTISDLEHFKDLLLEKEENVRHWLDSPNTPNSEDIQKAQSLVIEIKGALGRVENKTYGSCEVCKDGIELYRLEVQPVTEVCLGCITPEERAQLEEELYLASKIHRALLPQTVQKIEGFEIVVKSLAARIVGGDYYDFLPSAGDSSTRIIIADTMGKGIPAGLLMSNVQGALRILAEDIQSPSRLITRLNQWLCRNIPVTKFISLTCLALNGNSNSESLVTYTNAGHCPGLLIRSNRETQWLEPTGGVLGVHPGFTYDDMALQFVTGDLLILYTDGVTEAENIGGEMFGADRLLQYTQEHQAESLGLLVENLMAQVRFFTGRPEFADDFTIVALRKL
jgi:serine phosphatase RsbU (regulator of sigma subunit)